MNFTLLQYYVSISSSRLCLKDVIFCNYPSSAFHVSRYMSVTERAMGSLIPRASPSGRKKCRGKTRVEVTIIFPASRSFLHFINFKVKGPELFEN